jgi:hypothetical protein
MNMTERTAASPGLFLSRVWTGVAIGGGGATLTPHFGQISAFLSISAPQFWQNFVFRSLKLPPRFQNPIMRLSAKISFLVAAFTKKRKKVLRVKSLAGRRFKSFPGS